MAKRIFISSTSEDLREHRQRLMETLRRLQQHEAGMEWFGAEEGAPVAVCKRHVDEAELLVLIVAHRYGWVPRPEQGGDGESSITRIEYLQALKKKPVLAFIVADDAEWTSGAEQDRLLRARTADEALAVWRAVLALASFKAEIDASLVRDRFTTPADLADKAGTAIAKWLLQEQTSAHTLQELFAKTNKHLAQGEHEIALAYLEEAASSNPGLCAAIADKRLEIALDLQLSLHDARLWSAAEAVLALGSARVQAIAVLGRARSQKARESWQRGERQAAWQLAEEARANLAQATERDELDTDAFGALGGLLKRMVSWAREQREPSRARELEDAMLEAYHGGWRKVPHGYPLINYIEQRAIVQAQRAAAGGRRELLGAREVELRDALGRAVKQRESQLGKLQDRPWAAFDVARGRHYLNPNVAGFLEDLSDAVEDARLVARSAGDRYMVTNTIDALRGLIAAEVRVEGLREGLELLESAVASDDWYTARPRRSEHYLEAELLKLRAAMTDVTDVAGQQLALTAKRGAEAERFMQAAEQRFRREDEVLFQQELVQWRQDLAPQELKIVRALWKLFGKKALELLTPGIPVDWDEAAALAAKWVRG